VAITAGTTAPQNLPGRTGDQLVARSGRISGRADDARPLPGCFQESARGVLRALGGTAFPERRT